MKTDPRVDQYIAKAAAFAQPILAEVRKRVHQACPGAAETIKWNVPFFLLDEQLLVSVAAFKKHSKIVVWTEGKGAFIDVATAAELPSAKDFSAQVKHAAQLITAGETKTIRSRTSLAKKAPAKKAPAKKAPAKKAAAEKVPAKKAAAKKALAKRAK